MTRAPRAGLRVLEVKHPVYGPLRHVASPIKTGVAVATPAPAARLGEHTHGVLRDLCGYDPDRIAALRAPGALAVVPGGTMTAGP